MARTAERRSARPDVRPASLLAFAFALGIGAVGCDTGGLLVVEHHDKPVVQGPSVNEMANAGTLAKNGKYRLFYTLGQGTPNQGPVKSETKRLNGGIIGAAHGD